ncbi:MAG: biosynthetic peptidoglycan transglycosylase [Bacteroidales bacterium]
MTKKTGIIFISTVILLITLFMLLRGPVLRMYVDHKTKEAEARYSLVVSYDKLKMSGLAGIKISGLRILPLNGDTLFSADYIRLKMNPLKLLFLTPDLRRLDADNIKINFVKMDSLSNFDFLFRTGNKPSSASQRSKAVTGRLNYARNADNFLSLILGVLPANANISRMNICYFNGPYSLSIDVPELIVSDDCFRTEITSVDDGLTTLLSAEGILDDSERKITVRLFARDSAKVSVPFIDFKWGAEVQFDTLAFELSGSSRKSDRITLTGKAMAKGISVFHERISPVNVILDKGEFAYKIIIGKNYLELDSSSTAIINKFAFSPYLRAEKNREWQITASLNKPDFPADELFSSLPKGMFYNLEGIRTEGTLNYHFYLNLDFSRIDSLKLESSLVPKKFRIISSGKTNLRKMNSDFEYTAYENGYPVRRFIVGPENSNFRTLDRISPYLQMAVLQSEDGGFFYHGGFLLESLREALAEDIKEKKFRRGGSTISMQLVKNVFLSRNKTLARKFEEVMIVWLIETNRLSSKERMFEVYMNIIEWGPMVYGANEAARFYFDKDVKEININEAIFLASIIPSPKRSLNSFTDDLQLKPGMEGYYKLLAQRFRIKGLISEQEEAGIKPEVRLAGEAKRQIQNRAIP